MRSLLLCLTFAATASAQSLTTGERSIARIVDIHNAAALSLLERVVNINSGTGNLRGVREVGAIFMDELQSLGFTPGLEIPTRGPERAGTLVAVHPGRGPKILLIGHLDTVFEPSSPFQRFVRVNDSTATGPGIIDMKGGDVIVVFALRALKDAGLLDNLNITVVMTGDEEQPIRPLAVARKALVDAAQGATYAIGLEDGPADPHFGVVSRRSATNWKLTATGIPGHSSQIFRDDIGAGAIYEVSRILNSFRERLAAEQYLTVNPGLVVGGSAADVDSSWSTGTAAGKTNVVASTVTVSGDIRALSPDQLARAQSTMRDIVKASVPRTTAEITFDEGYPPLAPTEGNRQLLAKYDQVSRDLGFWPVQAVDPARAGAADAAFVAGIVPMIIDGVGLSGHDDHSDKETADLRMLPVQTKRLALLISRLSRP